MRNVGNLDKVIRLVLAVVFAVGGFMAGGAVSVVLFVLAAVMLLTALVGVCPLYRLVGVNTCSLDRHATR